MLQRAQLVQDTTEGPHIRGIGVRFTLAHFWGHVVWCALDCECLIVGVLKDFTDAEISKFDRVVGSQKHVLTL
jgi:hypothetical protein